MKIMIRQTIPLLSLCTTMLLGSGNVFGFGSMLEGCAPSDCTACHSASICPTPPICTDLDGDGYAVEGGDCGLVDFNDNNANAFPGADENCTDGIDNDGDGFVDAADPDASGCPLICTDLDGDGYSVEGGECGAIDFNDNNANAFPGADEICTDGIDNNGDGLVDADDPIASGCPMICTDLDGDGFAVEGGDCGVIDFNDNNSAAYPGASEDCLDGIDNDGDGLADAADPKAYNCPLYCTDMDNDGYNIDGGECGPIDCDDNDSAINPRALEICTDSIDNNCDGTIDTADMNAVNCPLTCTDLDGDGYSIEGDACGAIDCDDANYSVNPAALEICDDGIDNNCNNLSDALDSVCQIDDEDDEFTKPRGHSKGKGKDSNRPNKGNKGSDDKDDDDDDDEDDD